jgi:LAO/AO transport system kinase
MDNKVSDLVSKLKSFSPVAIARSISILADRREGYQELLSSIYREKQEGTVIGITGAPGAGKSTLVDCLIAQYRKEGRRVGVIAVDPSSPFTGGALLGDRVRMQRHATDPEVFIRSLASRGLLGGLGPATAETARLMGFAGFDPVIIETVGVGQAEVEVMGVADLVLMVLVPGSGDQIQCLKAGVMEIGDIFVVNKADRDGADKVAGEVEMLLHLAFPDDDPSQRMARTTATTGEGVADLVKQVEEAIGAFIDGGSLSNRRQKQLKLQLKGQLRDEFASRFRTFDSKAKMVDEATDKLYSGESDPVSLAKNIVDNYSKWLGGTSDR